MKDIPIEKGILIPARTPPGTKPFFRFPFNELEVGDSFFVSLDDWAKWREEQGKSKANLKSIQADVGTRSRRYSIQGKKFITRQVETPEKGLRVWRVV